MGSSEAQTSSLFPVELYVYDLSNGLARSMSLQLTGRYFEAIYHTAIVVYGREWYFGQGIFNDRPGQTHFGVPIKRINLGQTSVDEETFKEILEDLRQRYTAQAYHLLQFNCNTFTNEVANILVGRDIPADITSLPQDFLSTPLGRMMGPQIDAMFRGPTAQAGASRGAAMPPPPGAMGILNSVTQQTVQKPVGTAAKAPPASSIQELHTTGDFDAFLTRAPLSVVMFTSQTCPPCVQIHPVYESLAEKHSEAKSYKQRPIVFAKVESSARSAQLMQRVAITATPTFLFYKNGQKWTEMKGANSIKLSDEIENLLWQLYRPHPHSKLTSPASLVPQTAIIYKTTPNLMTAEQKLNDIISQYKAKSFDEKADLQESRSVFSKVLFPWIRMRGKMTDADRIRWIKAVRKAVEILSVAELFPIVDLVRIALLDADQVHAVVQSEGISMLEEIFAKVGKDIVMPANKATLITTFRLIGNALGDEELGQRVVDNADIVTLLVSGVLSEEQGVRLAAINATFNWSRLRGQSRGLFMPVDSSVAQDNAEKDVEILCAIVECIEKEQDSERLHRAVASLAVVLYCIPDWQENVCPLLEVIETESKLQKVQQRIAKESIEKGKEIEKILQVILRLCRAE